MSESTQQSPARAARLPHYALAAVAAVAVVLAGMLTASGAGADLQSKLDEKQAALDQAQEKKGVLTSDIDSYDDRIDLLTGQVAALRNREAEVQVDLDAAEARLDSEKQNLKVQRERLAHSVDVLRDRLVAMYKTGEPDALTVVLESDGFDDVLQRYEYLQRIQTQDSDIVGNVRELRNDAKETVDRITEVRNEIAAKKAELERTRISLEQREAELQGARAKLKDALSKTNENIDHLEGDISDVEDEIQKQLMAASGVTALPAGPIRQGSGSMIWPVDGPVVSPFGMRWGRLHAGVDIAVPAGTPIRAADDGTIALVQSEAESGGYGNYTCIDHGGGLSTCYAHQSSQAITSGSVSQGDVIGYVGCTGHCYGDHLHFEVRINGSPTDPLPYL
jgi:murein DD-endopeptidase MepM/ murein hydrolase activator NlpD